MWHVSYKILPVIGFCLLKDTTCFKIVNQIGCCSYYMPMGYVSLENVMISKGNGKEKE